MTVEVHIDTRSLEQMGRQLKASPRVMETALIRAMNRAGDAAGTEVRKALVKATGIKSGDTRRSKGIAKKLATKSEPAYRLKARSLHTPLSYFNPTTTKRGVRASPWKRRVLFEGTFMMRMSSGYVGVFKRQKAAARQTFKHRKTGKEYQARPIKELWGPSLAREMGRGQIPGVFNSIARAKTAERLPHEIAYELSKVGMKRGRRGGS